MTDPAVIGIYNAYSAKGIIGRLHGFWPGTADLYHWIHTSWTEDCEISLCNKGFFTVYFNKQEGYQKAMENGPWFWGKAGLFMTPCLPDFDPNKMSVTRTPIWVRLLKLPLHFWSSKSLEAISNKIGFFLKIDLDRAQKWLATYVQICLEADLSEGLPDNIILKWNNTK